MLTLHQRILATAAYAAIFDYPLTRAELTRWLIGKSTKRIVLPRQLVRVGEYVLLPGQRSTVALRRKKEHWSGEKLTLGKKIAKILALVPTVEFIGVTGGVAVGNAAKADDVDLYLVCTQGTLWITRLLVTMLVELLGKRRRPGDRRVRDKACLNMFVRADALALPQFERDLFAAHEVVQMVPVFERNNTYQRFLRANAWVREFLPNAWEEKVKSQKSKVKSQSKDFSFFIFHFSFRILEPLARFVQLWYMRRHRTTEVVTDTVLRFHPRDARGWIKQKFATRLRRFGIPLDKVFCAG